MCIRDSLTPLLRAKRKGPQNSGPFCLTSYLHDDRQHHRAALGLFEQVVAHVALDGGLEAAVSYTHLDVYKRQGFAQCPARSEAAKAAGIIVITAASASRADNSRFLILKHPLLMLSIV